MLRNASATRNRGLSSSGHKTENRLYLEPLEDRVVLSAVPMAAADVDYGDDDQQQVQVADQAAPARPDLSQAVADSAPTPDMTLQQFVAHVANSLGLQQRAINGNSEGLEANEVASEGTDGVGSKLEELAINGNNPGKESGESEEPTSDVMSELTLADLASMIGGLVDSDELPCLGDVVDAQKDQRATSGGADELTHQDASKYDAEYLANIARDLIESALQDEIASKIPGYGQDSAVGLLKFIAGVIASTFAEELLYSAFVNGANEGGDGQGDSGGDGGSNNDPGGGFTSDDRSCRDSQDDDPKPNPYPEGHDFDDVLDNLFAEAAQYDWDYANIMALSMLTEATPDPSGDGGPIDPDGGDPVDPDPPNPPSDLSDRGDSVTQHADMDESRNAASP